MKKAVHVIAQAQLQEHPSNVEYTEPVAGLTISSYNSIIRIDCCCCCCVISSPTSRHFKDLVSGKRKTTGAHVWRIRWLKFHQGGPMIWQCRERSVVHTETKPMKNKNFPQCLSRTMVVHGDCLPGNLWSLLRCVNLKCCAVDQRFPADSELEVKDRSRIPHLVFYDGIIRYIHII